jgi:TetR/AcrR family transcriptional repressor of nem operon
MHLRSPKTPKGSAMRYSSGQKEKTRARIVDAASKAFRQYGYHATGVDRVMEEAGLTAGAFYVHFSSKEALFAAAFSRAASQAVQARTQGLEHARGHEWIATFIQRYLSLSHVHGSITELCPFAALSCEIAQVGETPRQAFEASLQEVSAAFAEHLMAGGTPSAEEKALALLALCIGGMSLARAASNEHLAERILTACRKFALAVLLDENRS